MIAFSPPWTRLLPRFSYMPPRRCCCCCTTEQKKKEPKRKRPRERIRSLTQLTLVDTKVVLLSYLNNQIVCFFFLFWFSPMNFDSTNNYCLVLDVVAEFAGVVHGVGGVGAAVRGRQRQAARLLQERPSRQRSPLRRPHRPGRHLCRRRHLPRRLLRRQRYAKYNFIPSRDWFKFDAQQGRTKQVGRRRAQHPMATSKMAHSTLHLWHGIEVKQLKEDSLSLLFLLFNCLAVAPSPGHRPSLYIRSRPS